MELRIGAPQSARGEVTLLLERAQRGDDEAVSHLAVLVFPELRRLALAVLRDQPQGHTWMPTDLVNDLWVRLLKRETIDYQNRSHFLACAAHLMRALVIDHARARCAAKRVPPEKTVPLNESAAFPLSDTDAAELVALDAALDGLAKISPRKAQVVELRYFADFTVEETAEALGLSERTVKREWAQARAWLHAELRGIAV